MIQFDRVGYKTSAKDVLRHDYWKAFFACLIASVLGAYGGSAGSGTGISFSAGGDAGRGYAGDTSGYGVEWITILMIVAICLVVFILAFVVAFAVSCFLANPILLGSNRFFIKHIKMDDSSEIGDLFSLFKKDVYMASVKTMFWYRLRIFLWSLLFVIPGIVKSYEYFFVPYIVAEQPTIDRDRAFAMSKEMTDGRKMKIFVTVLSFIGWNLLGACCCGVGVLFVYPYMQATYACMYKDIKEQMNLQVI